MQEEEGRPQIRTRNIDVHHLHTPMSKRNHVAGL
jgi:hypothetical protein